MQHDATHYERKEYGIVDLVGKSGGFINVIFRSFMVIVAIACNTNVNSSLMYIIYSKKVHHPDSDHKQKSDSILSLQSSWFQLKYFLVKICCCGNRLCKKVCYRNARFKDLSQFYEDNYAEILRELTVSYYINRVS